MAALWPPCLTQSQQEPPRTAGGGVCTDTHSTSVHRLWGEAGGWAAGGRARCLRSEGSHELPTDLSWAPEARTSSAWAEQEGQCGGRQRGTQEPSAWGGAARWEGPAVLTPPLASPVELVASLLDPGWHLSLSLEFSGAGVEVPGIRLKGVQSPSPANALTGGSPLLVLLQDTECRRARSRRQRRPRKGSHRTRCTHDPGPPPPSQAGAGAHGSCTLGSLLP